MGFLKIHCGSCGGSWEVYACGNFTDEKNAACPHCSAAIDSQDWRNSILPAFGEMMDANRELSKTAAGYNATLFRVEYIENTISHKRRESSCRK